MRSGLLKPQTSATHDKFMRKQSETVHDDANDVYGDDEYEQDDNQFT